jgi:hypothetical protein
MAAFPQLGYGYHSNTSHIVKEVQASKDAELWWRHCLTDDQKIELIIKRHPNCINQSQLMRLSLWRLYNNNPQKLYDEWVKDNKPEEIKLPFTKWLKKTNK